MWFRRNRSKVSRVEPPRTDSPSRSRVLNDASLAPKLAVDGEADRHTADGYQASFQIPAVRALGAGSAQALADIVDAFAPSQPVVSAEQFAGRVRELRLLIDAIEEYRSHVVLHGPVGAGKTSIVRAVLASAGLWQYQTLYISCSRGATLESLFTPVLASISRRFDRLLDQERGKAEGTQTFLDISGKGPLTPQTVGQTLSRVSGIRLLIALDEFQRIEDSSLVHDLVEVMKILSDNIAPVQLIISGADLNPSPLLDGSTKLRSLFIARLGFMRDAEIKEMVLSLTYAARLKMAPPVAQRIVALARGKPYLGRLMGLQAAKYAVLRQSNVIDVEDLEDGLARVADYLQAAGFGIHRSLIKPLPKVLHILNAALRCERDADDFFTLQELALSLDRARGPVLQIDEISQSLDLLAAEDTRILERGAAGEQRYRFADPRVELQVALLGERTYDASKLGRIRAKSGD